MKKYRVYTSHRADWLSNEIEKNQVIDKDWEISEIQYSTANYRDYQVLHSALVTYEKRESPAKLPFC